MSPSIYYSYMLLINYYYSDYYYSDYYYSDYYYSDYYHYLLLYYFNYYKDIKPPSSSLTDKMIFFLALYVFFLDLYVLSRPQPFAPTTFRAHNLSRPQPF